MAAGTMSMLPVFVLYFAAQQQIMEAFVRSGVRQVNRWLQLECALNFRDLGGYSTPQGTTVTGKLFRSDALSKLTERDVARPGPATVVDLRSPSELEANPGVFANHARVCYYHNPVATLGPTDVAPHERLLALDFAAHNVEMVRASG